MATLVSAEGRCINCKTAMKPDRDDCSKCGDPVRPKTKIEKEVKPIGTTLSDEQVAAHVHSNVSGKRVGDHRSGPAVGLV